MWRRRNIDHRKEGDLETEIVQRYYGVGTGRFNVPDPYRASAGAADPASWNRYVYVQGDPTNFRDPSGLVRCLKCEEDDEEYAPPPFKPYDGPAPTPPGAPSSFGPVNGDGTKMKQFSDDW
jgi:RHS repeat-associated protein